MSATSVLSSFILLPTVCLGGLSGISQVASCQGTAFLTSAILRMEPFLSRCVISRNGLVTQLIAHRKSFGLSPKPSLWSLNNISKFLLKINMGFKISGHEETGQAWIHHGAAGASRSQVPRGAQWVRLHERLGAASVLL